MPYTIHTRGHEGLKYRCEYCGNTFLGSMRWKYHMSEHTGNYQFRCETCGQGFHFQPKFLGTRRKPYGSVIMTPKYKSYSNNAVLWFNVHDFVLTRNNLNSQVITVFNMYELWGATWTPFQQLTQEKPHRNRIFCPVLNVARNFRHVPI